MKNKKTIILTSIALVTLLVIVIGATYSYFTGSNTISGTTNLTITTEKIGTITITNPTEVISMKLTAADMDELSKGVSYYATTSGANNASTAEYNPVSRLKIENGEDNTVYNCSYTINVEKSELIKSGDASLIFTLDGASIEGITSGAEIDMYGAASSYIVKFNYTGNIDAKDIVKVAIKYNNTSEDQRYLSGQTLITTITNSELDCTIGDTQSSEQSNGIAEYVLANASSSDLWDSTLEDDGYRYVGTDPSNYVCFGYSNAETDCDFTNATNSDKYAYRIIGLFEDSSGNQHVKLIKKEALNTGYAWTADEITDVAWSASDMYKGINGSYFLDNTSYSYMQNSTWLSKIADWTYTATNTKTYESSGPNYLNSVTVQNIYLHEMNRSTKTSTIGVWNNVPAKIGLMYVSDYTLSLGSSALSYTT